MARLTSKKTKSVKAVKTAIRTNATVTPKKSYLERIELEVTNNQSKLNLILGILIVLVVGILLFNYFSKNKAQQQTQSSNTQQAQNGDVTTDNLPGKYTVKEGDTLFEIANKYYKDGYQYTTIAQANKLTNADNIEVGQTIEIPKLAASDSAQTDQTTVTPSEQPSTAPSGQSQAVPSGDTTWGLTINSDKYTVQAGDWLSTIAGRAYGDIMAYQKIAQANNISNPDLIEPGTILKIPR